MLLRSFHRFLLYVERITSSSLILHSFIVVNIHYMLCLQGYVYDPSGILYDTVCIVLVSAITLTLNTKKSGLSVNTVLNPNIFKLRVMDLQGKNLRCYFLGMQTNI